MVPPERLSAPLVIGGASVSVPVTKKLRGAPLPRLTLSVPVVSAVARLLVPDDVTLPLRTRVATAPDTPAALPTLMVAPVRVRPPAPTVSVCVVAWPSPMLTVVELLTLSELVV